MGAHSQPDSVISSTHRPDRPVLGFRLTVNECLAGVRYIFYLASISVADFPGLGNRIGMVYRRVIVLEHTSLPASKSTRSSRLCFGSYTGHHLDDSHIWVLSYPFDDEGGDLCSEPECGLIKVCHERRIRVPDKEFGRRQQQRECSPSAGGAVAG